jgi:hypothetical protein
MGLSLVKIQRIESLRATLQSWIAKSGCQQVKRVYWQAETPLLIEGAVLPVGKNKNYVR